MSDSTMAFRLKHLTDGGYRMSWRKAGGDVVSATADGMAHVMRQLVEMPPGSATVTLRFVYVPRPPGKKADERLSIYLVARAHLQEQAPSLSAILTGNPVRGFHDLEPAPLPRVNWASFNAACEIVRRQTILAGTVSKEFNPDALPAYWMLSPLKSNDRNDYMQFDTCLHLLDTPAVADLCLAPVCSRRVRSSGTRFLLQLQHLVRPWDPEDDLGQNAYELGPWSAAAKTLRQVDPVAEQVLQSQRGLHPSLALPQLGFTFRVFTETVESARCMASTLAEGGFTDGSYQLVDLAKGDDHFERAIQAAGDLRVEALPVLQGLVEGQNVDQLFQDLAPLANMATVEELSGAFRPPVAGRMSPCCIRKNTDPPPTDPQKDIVLGHDAESKDLPGMAPAPLGISLEFLCSHIFGTGTTGTGKTTQDLQLVGELARHGVPFIIFELGRKTDYRRLKGLIHHRVIHLRKLAKNLRIYTPGQEAISPFRLNPLELAPGIPVNENIESVVQCFQGAFPMGGPLPALLAEALELVYDEYSGADDPPTMTDLVKAAHIVLASKGYSPDVTSDIMGALLVRAGVLTRRSIGRIFQCRHSHPSIEDLMSGQSVIELSSLPQDQACLLTLFLLNAICQRAKSSPWSGKGIRLVIILEEAHNVVGRDTNAVASEDNANPKAHATAAVCAMLAEMRGLGIGMVILDQSPSAVAQDAIRNTATKVAFRLPDGEDRRIVGDAMLFGPDEDEQNARLACGMAYLFGEGYSAPRLMRVPNVQSDWGLPPAPVGVAILPCLAKNAWFLNDTNARVGEELELLHRAMDAMDGRCHKSIAQVMDLVRAHAAAIECNAAVSCGDSIRELVRQAVPLQSRLSSELANFRHDLFVPLVGEDPPAGVLVPSLAAQRDQLIDRFVRVIVPGMEACLGVLEGLIRKCQASLDPTT
jgi:hypothetical protein